MELVRFEWDEAKAEANLRKHGVAFEEARRLLEGAEFLEIFDEDHSDTEERFVAVGPVEHGVITTVYTERDDDVVRIISARTATPAEIRMYQQYVEAP